METLSGFPPIADSISRILILGSMPGEASLRKAQYYGHPQNAFWRLMATLLCEPFTEDYAQRTAMLLRHGVALWDVVNRCERTGSLDSNIKNPKINDFTSFFSLHPAIRRVYFNGQTAYNLFCKNVGFAFTGIAFARLGSTSPAHAVAFEKRIADWRQILPLE
jgi:double-stranded uracil-DNA glycosylase